MYIICLLLLLLSGGFFIYGLYLRKHTKIINEEVEQENKKLESINKTQTQNKAILENQLKILEKQFLDQTERIEKVQEKISKTLEGQKELSNDAFQNYFEILEKQYKEAEEEYEMEIDALQTAYSNLQLKLMREADECRKDLDKIRSSRAAAIQAQLREQEIENNKDNYRLNLSESSLRDIKLLKSIQSDITNPIVIDKIIWSNYYQPLAKIKFPKIIGKETACGIYKITSLVTGAVYIGQSVDICDRLKQHCKNALGVGNNNSDNKLYSTIRKEGLSNFTFEVLEECDSKLLNEKEKYYIELYNSYNFGLNSNRGNG